MNRLNRTSYRWHQEFKNVHNIIFEWPRTTWHWTWHAFVCYGFSLWYPSNQNMPRPSVVLFIIDSYITLVVEQLHLVISVGKMSSTAFTTASQFWLLFTFLLITISLELALLIFKLDLWIQAWTLREQNQQEVLDLSQRWVLVKNAFVMMWCIISSRFVVTSQKV